METKKELVDDFLIRILQVDSDFGFSYVPLVGSSAGLCLIWNSLLVTKPLVLQGDSWISLSFNWHNLIIRVILVYASSDVVSRRSVWLDLHQLLSFEGAILLMGDFNEVTCPAERFNCLKLYASI